jgi:hypothetical protein
MRIDFFDTSAVVKRYHRELGSDIIDAAFAGEEGFSVIDLEEPPEAERER